MKTTHRVWSRCIGVFVCILPVSALADETSVTASDGAVASKEAPRLLFDNIMGMRVRSSAPSFGEPEVTGGPMTLRIRDGHGLPIRSMQIGTEIDGRVGTLVTVGAAAGFSTSWYRIGIGRDSYESNGYILSLEPRVGLLIPLSEGLYLWPRVGPTLTVGPGGGKLGAAVDTSLVVSVHKHVFIAVGPRLEYTRFSAGYSDPEDELHLSFSSRIGLSF